MRAAILAFLFYFSAQTILAQSQPMSGPSSYDREAVVVEQAETAFRYESDGTGDTKFRMRVKIKNDAGTRQLSVISIPFASASESVQITGIRVTHPDGTTTETPESDAMELPAEVAQQAPLYSDAKNEQIPVRGLRTGDTLEYSAVIQRKAAEAPGQFWGGFMLAKDTVILAQTLTLDVPSDKYVQVWSPEHKPVVIQGADRTVYQWKYSQLSSTGAKQNDEAAKAGTDKKPSVAWTTFRSWEEVGNWYRALASPRAVATEALRAQADEITAEAKTPEAQIQALYSWVATRIRYVGIDFGTGRYEPHSAAQVLVNHYGDCKDKDTLLEALLRAKGFQPAPAMIGADIEMVFGAFEN